MFANAKPVNLKTAKPAKSAYKPTDSIAGWEQLAALDAASKALAALVDLRKQEIIDNSIRPELIARGIAAHRKPDALSPQEGLGKGSAYLTKRNSRSALADDEIALIGELADAAEFCETIQAQPSMLAVNPAYAQDQALLKRIDKALAAVKDLPEDFIIQTESETKTIVADAAIDNLFKLDADAVEQLLPILTSTVLRPVFSGSLEGAWELIRPLMPEAAGAVASKPKTPVANGNAAATLKRQLKASLKAGA